MCDFKEGDEVICVAGEDELETGKTYVVYAVFVLSPKTHEHARSVEPPIEGAIGVNVGACIWERVAIAKGHPDQAGWYAWRFRKPIVDETPVEAQETVSA